jgi:hypothetical protein
VVANRFYSDAASACALRAFSYLARSLAGFFFSCRPMAGVLTGPSDRPQVSPGIPASGVRMFLALLHTSYDRPLRFCPVGASENSPAIHRWVRLSTPILPGAMG